MRRLIFALLIVWPIMSFGQGALVALSANQAKAIVIACQALENESEREQLDVVLQEEPEHFIVSFGKDVAKDRSLRGGGTRIISYKISKRTFEIVSTSRSLAK